MSQWKPISSAPQNKFILLRGPSNMISTPYQIILGQQYTKYRGDAWLDVYNDRLTNSGFIPTEWMEAPP